MKLVEKLPHELVRHDIKLLPNTKVILVQGRVLHIIPRAANPDQPDP